MKEIKPLEFLNAIRMFLKELQTFEKFEITLDFIKCEEQTMYANVQSSSFHSPFDGQTKLTCRIRCFRSTLRKTFEIYTR